MTTVEAWLYGSVARGTHTERSDLDVLVVSDHEVEPAWLKSVITGLPQQPHLAARRYSWDEVDQMADYGSLFLLHIKLEGRPLTAGSGRLAAVLENLPPYRLEQRDVRGFRQALDDVEWSLSDTNDAGDIAFELGVVATVIRHCSILACYKLRDPQFQTERSIRSAFRTVGMSWLVDEALRLYDFRLAISRAIAISSAPSKETAHQWVTHARGFVEEVGRLP